MASETVERPVHTYSIVACDPSTGELGVAVQSHWFNVGSIVAWAQAGVGAVATQSFANVSFGPRGLTLLRSGDEPRAALDTLLSDDPGKAVRQVAIVDARGRVAVHTGDRCIAWAGHAIGDGWSAQANMMIGAGVPAAMGAAFEEERGPLAHRLLTALEAAQTAGGDLRGQQSAALRVVACTPEQDGRGDPPLDLRVEDHQDPLAELRRIYDIHRAYAHMNAGDAAVERSDMGAAMREYEQASDIQPDNIEIRFWAAFTLSTNGRLEESIPMFRGVFARDPRWRELLRRLPAAGLCEEALASEILVRASATGSSSN